jgi:hypothetical protein
MHKQQPVLNDGSRGKRGRPPGRNLRPEHAELLRKTVKAATRYYGVRVKDLSATSASLVDALRTGRPMSVATAQRLWAIVESPHPNLVGSKKPQGPSMSEVWEVMITGGFSSKQPPLNAATEYFACRMLASLILQRYLCPTPGTVLFVLPGAAHNLALSLAEQLPLGAVSPKRRRDFVDVLTSYFEQAEQPLATKLGERLVPRLVVMGMINNLNLLAKLQKEYPDDDVANVFQSLEEASNLEHLREVAREQPARRPRPRKRRVFMPALR